MILVKICVEHSWPLECPSKNSTILTSVPLSNTPLSPFQKNLLLGRNAFRISTVCQGHGGYWKAYEKWTPMDIHRWIKGCYGKGSFSCVSQKTWGRISFFTPFLVDVQFAETVNRDQMARLINDSLRKIDGNFEAKVLISDAGPYMIKTGKSLQVFFPKLLHVTCLAHGISLVCEKAFETFPDVNLSNVKDFPEIPQQARSM